MSSIVLNVAAWVCSVVLFLFAWSIYFSDREWDQWKACALVMEAVAATIMLAIAISCTLRSVRRVRCQKDRRYLARIARDLDSPWGWKRWRALGMLAEVFGDPLGVIEKCWPLRPTAERRKIVEQLYREWWKTTESQKWTDILHSLRAERVPAVVPLISRQMCVERLRVVVQPALVQVADAIDETFPGRTMSSGVNRLSDVFSRVHRDVLHVGMHMRIQAWEDRWRSEQLALSEQSMPDVAILLAATREKLSLAEFANFKTSPAIHQGVLELQSRLETTLNRVADIIKDALLDLGTRGSTGASKSIDKLLPPLCTEIFFEKMRSKLEKTLLQLAETIDQDFPGRSLALCDISDPCWELWREALDLAMQMRIEAARAASGLCPQTRRALGQEVLSSWMKQGDGASPA